MRIQVLDFKTEMWPEFVPPVFRQDVQARGGLIVGITTTDGDQARRLVPPDALLRKLEGKVPENVGFSLLDIETSHNYDAVHLVYYQVYPKREDALSECYKLATEMVALFGRLLTGEPEQASAS